jgi:hypothetical protein
MVFDAVLTYNFIKKLTTPFEQMPAYKLQLINDKGQFLKPRNQMTSQEKNALGIFDVMIINLKRLIAKVPGGASRLGTIAATLVLLNTRPGKNVIFREDFNLDIDLEEEFNKAYNQLKEDSTPVNVTTGIAGLSADTLGVPLKAAMKYKKKNQQLAGPILSDILKRKKLSESSSSLNESFSYSFNKEDTTLQYHKQLNTKLWDVMGQLKQDVKDKLIQIADAWIAFAKIPSVMVYDIVITGGNVNYNYTPNSDIDLHIVMSRSAINPDRAFVDEYLQDKKILWTLQHPNISIYGYPVELYAQDIDEQPHANQGVYSIVQDKWLARPQMLDLNFEDDYHLQKKVQFYKDMIDKMIADNASDDTIDVLKDKIKQMRSDSIAKEGEFAFGNLVFKDLRNAGYLDKLNDYKKTKQDKILSLGRP